MRFIKKLLRLIPFFYLVGMFLFVIFKHDNTITSYFDELQTYFGKIFIPQLFGLSNTLFSNLYNWLVSNLINTQNTFIRISFFVLFYELILSILFLMFDLFNFILGIANKWINKGENI